ncbi:MAG: type I-B CRISPR-associated protein Cas7/Cst2/DevR [Anaerolineales bacterium]|nr:type I-B CRISPR-associated protein Cas7/Cst2/DevR [Anaerolineales bacterium]MCB9127123.1 type I-B CRISPR-associated protein Cas7/Cst2/DevR [Ardenticatenales bacterium]
MAFVTGLILVDAPASALNNLGSIPGARTDNTVGVKVIRTKEGFYPYVSAQAFRYWWRTTLENADLGWKAAPIYRESKVAYTDGNPILYWDDDLFGYMRAPSKKQSAKEQRESDSTQETATETKDTITRVSPLRVGTLVSIAPVTPTDDFGTMSRHEGDPVPHEHQFYRTTLKGLLSLDLHAAGTFSYANRTGFRHLDKVRVDLAEANGLEHLEDEQCYRLPARDRAERIAALFEGLARLEGGAKQALHYTDVTPSLTLFAVTKGGNNMFGHVVGANSKGQPIVKIEALEEALRVFNDQLLSKVYVGWTQGYLDDERETFMRALSGNGTLAEFAASIQVMHPREAFQQVAEEIRQPQNLTWLA